MNNSLLTNALYFMRTFFYSAVFAREHKILKAKKLYQKNAYWQLKSRFRSYYEEIRNLNIETFITPHWNVFNSELEKHFLPYPDFSFLRDYVVIKTMFMMRGGELLKKQIMFLEQNIPEDRLMEVLEEDYMGNPVLLNSKYLTSHNDIHHLFHLANYFKAINCPMDTIKTVVEWGGGYGNMAKMFKKYKMFNGTYIIVDTPLVSCLQWLYLASLLGESTVILMTAQGQRIVPGKINLVPVCFVKDVQMQADMFISTWALSESAMGAQTFVVNNNWFGAKHLLLAYHGQYNGQHNARLSLGGFDCTKDNELKINEINFLPGNYYAFK